VTTTQVNKYTSQNFSLLSFTPLINIPLEYLRKFFGKNLNGPNGMLRGPEELIHEKNLKLKISCKTPFKGFFSLHAIHDHDLGVFEYRSYHRFLRRVDVAFHLQLIKLCAHCSEDIKVVYAIGAQLIHGGSCTPALQMKHHTSVHFSGQNTRLNWHCFLIFGSCKHVNFYKKLIQLRASQKT
jgi:hypothetical protein